MANILIIFSTTDGHTRKICDCLQSIVEKSGHTVTLASINKMTAIDPKAFDKIVIGASIRYGKHHIDVYNFIKNNLQLLQTKPNAFFSVNVVARKPEKSQPATNPYLKKFLRQISWQPKELAVFAGKLDYQKCSFWDRFMIRLIMRMTKGPTDPQTKIEFTDWKQVENFGLVISRM